MTSVETASSVLWVKVLWGENVLHVAHRRAPFSFVVGESANADYVVDSELLGASSANLVTDVTGHAAVPAAVSLGALTFLFETSIEGPPPETSRVVPRSRDPEAWMAASVAVHAAFLVMFYLMPPRPPALSPELLSERIRSVQLLPTAEPELHVSVTTMGGTGTRHEGESGAMGVPTSAHTQRRYAVEGTERSVRRRIAATPQAEQVQATGALGVLASMSGVLDAPTSPYGGQTALGGDPMSALGALMGDQIGDNFGVGGLGMRGTGRGGGGTGVGTVGLGTIGTIGHGAGLGSGQGYGAGSGGFRDRVSSAPTAPLGEAEVRGGLGRDAVRRVVRQHLNEVRFCYEQALAQRPGLAGRVTVTFLIAGTGVVSSSSTGGSTLGDARVEGCVSQAVSRWSFPAGNGGGSTLVSYPFVFDAPS